MKYEIKLILDDKNMHDKFECEKDLFDMTKIYIDQIVEDNVGLELTIERILRVE